MLRSLLLIFVMAAPAAAGTITGSVRNGTTDTVAAGQTVVLIKLTGGMEELDSIKTDAQGRYKFDRAEIGQQPFLIRVNYRGVNYHASAPAGQTIADVQIFEPTASNADLRVVSRAVIVQPNGTTLLVGEEYEVSNVSKPPAAFSKEFEFAIPADAEIAQVSAWGPSGMPTVQGTINKGANRFGVAYPLRPGQNGIRLSYQLPYATQQAKIGAASPFAAQTVMVIAPPTMQIAGAGFQAAGQREGWNVFARNGVPASQPLDISVSGTAPPPADSSGEGAARSGAAPGVEVRTMPERLGELKWILTVGFAAMFFLGAVYLWRKPGAAPVPAMAGSGSSTSIPVPAAGSGPLQQVQLEVKHSLDELKDSLFRLELRRQAGTISEEDYARERGRAEQVIRKLVRD